MEKKIRIRGARTHNLKNIDLDLPRNQLIVFTGLSGSGKSSLAFDTIYAEGQRRYVESLSNYAKQFIALMDKPDFDLIEGLSPAIAIDQRLASINPRSTVGTITEIYDNFRLFYSKLGVPHCPHCKTELKKIIQVKSKKAKGSLAKKEKKEDQALYQCSSCSFNLNKLEPRNFSFNSNYGACDNCSGLGTKLEIDPDLVFNLKLSILEGAIKPISHVNLSEGNALYLNLQDLARRYDFSLNEALKNLKVSQRAAILNGDKIWPGIKKELMRRHEETKSNFVRQEIEKCMRVVTCPSCDGKKLKLSSLYVKYDDLNIYDLSSKTISELIKFLKEKLRKIKKDGASEILKIIFNEALKKLQFLEAVGLHYLSLNRSSASLSGGELQRIRLATQVCSTLSGVIYVLDEPSVGLHQRDNEQLIEILKKLRDNGNTVLVVEHDASMIQSADYLVDIGPGAGEHGGEILFTGNPAKIKSSKKSITGAYLSGKKEIIKRQNFRKGNGKYLKILKAREHNLKEIDVKIPLGKLIAITGVSGSGKSTLMTDILANALNKRFYRAKLNVGAHDSIEGIEHINKVISIDQSPIGKTPRSNPATYTGVFTYIRDLFASLPEAKIRNFSPGHFSFNVSGGRCENCSGDGFIKVEMQFLNDVFLTCELCQGKRFEQKILEIKYQDKNIYEVLEMTVSEALRFFKDKAAIYQKLKTLEDVGLGYIRLGQSATTFSGGESQRIKLASELSRRATGKTLYILDEPTTGLHFADIDRLLKVLNILVDQGNTVLIIEHNLDLIRSVDWIIDLGPDGGEKGGYLIAEGSPKDILKVKNSYTAKYLKELL